MLQSSQARHQSNVTGGGGGGQKNIWGTQINFTLIFGSDDQKTKQKKVLILAVYLFRGTSLGLGEGGAERSLMVQNSFLSHKFRCEDKKKGFWRKISGFVFAFTRVYRPRTKFYSCLGGGTSSIFGGHRPRNALQWHLACYFLSEHNPRLGSTLLAWGGGTRSDLGGAFSPEMPPVAPGLEAVCNKFARTYFCVICACFNAAATFSKKYCGDGETLATFHPF